MNRNKILASLLLATAVSFTAQATTLVGNVAVRMVIGAGCSVDNTSVVGLTGQWGTLDFGTQAALRNPIAGSVIGADGSSAVSITCSTGITPSLSLNGGLRSTGGVRAMSAGLTDSVRYRLYSDAARSSEIAVNGNIAIPADGAAHNIPIYGQVLPADQTNLSPAAGIYTDIVIATLTW